MLEKPEFDCNNLGEFYDCGCSDEEEDKSGESKKDGPSAATRGGASESHSAVHDHLAVEISKEALVSHSVAVRSTRG